MTHYQIAALAMLKPSEISDLLDHLDEGPADALESETLEFKSWDPQRQQHKAQIRNLRETVVAFANARGGLIVLGVADRKRTRCDAIHGVGDLDAAGLRRDIYDGTEPHILVEVDELQEPEGRLLVVRVPPGMPPHTTTDGVARIRVGKDSKPLTGSTLAQLVVTRRGRDVTADTVPGVRFADLDQEQVDRLRQTIATESERRNLAGLGNRELLQALGLISGSDITLAAVLLVGKRPTLARHAPQHELMFTRQRSPTRYDVRRDLRGPLLEVLDEVQRLLDANLKVSTADISGFQRMELPDISWWVAREAILNALVHRDYFLHQSIHLALNDGRTEVTSPGGFVGGVTARNVLRHPPVRRNPLLADVLQAIGLVNRAGLGVDRIYEELLLLGKDLPRYDADESHVRLVLPTKTHADFVRFVHEARRGGVALDLDDLILLRGLTRRRSLDRWTAADLLQRPDAEASEQLVSLRERGYVTAQGRGRGTVYRLAHRHADLVDAAVPAEDDIWVDEESVRLRLIALLSERGRLTNHEIRSISGYSRVRVLRLMRTLRDEGLVEFRGRGRGAHYVPGAIPRC